MTENRQLPMFSSALEAPMSVAGPYSDEQRARLEKEAHALALGNGAKTGGWRQAYAYILAKPDETPEEFDKRMRKNRKQTNPTNPCHAGWVAYGWQRGGVQVRVVVPQFVRDLTADVLEEACALIALVGGEPPDVVRARVLVGRVGA